MTAKIKIFEKHTSYIDNNNSLLCLVYYNYSIYSLLYLINIYCIYSRSLLNIDIVILNICSFWTFKFQNISCLILLKEEKYLASIVITPKVKQKYK